MFRRRNRPVQVASSKPIVTEASNHEGRLIRPVPSPSEVLAHLFHDLGIQSNVLVSAQYTHTTSHSKLTPKKVHLALRKVIQEHPALSTIGVSRPSTKKEGNHRLWEAHLPLINFRDCVEFLDVNLNDDGDGQLAQIFKDVHNTWFDTADKTKPWWKVVVINGEIVVFVFHHSIADGMSGYAFHRSFLAALNDDDGDDKDITDVNSDSVITPRIDPASLPNPLNEVEETLFWLHVLSTFLFWVLIRFFISSKYFLFSDAVVSPHYPTIRNPFPKSDRTVTKVAILRIDSKTMSKILASCREQKTSFTALLHTLIQTTLSINEYPDALVCFSRQAVNVRNLLKKDRRISTDTIINAVSVYYRFDLLSKLRKVSLFYNTTDPYAQDKNNSESDLDPEQIWALARKYKQDLNAAIFENGAVIQEFLTLGLLGEDEEDIGGFFGLGLYQNNSFLVSNLGVFEEREVMGVGGWKVSDVGFSAAAVRANLGDFGMAFNVSSVRGGDCVVTASWEAGVLREDMVRRVLGRVGMEMRILVA